VLERPGARAGAKAPPRVDPPVETSLEQLDLATVVKVSQAVSSEVDVKRSIESLLRTALEHAGAERGLLLVPRGEELRVEAQARTMRDGIEVTLRPAAGMPESLLRYVVRTRELLLLDDASDQSAFADDPFIRESRTRSVLCLPLLKQTKLIAVLYLENNLSTHVFTPARTTVLRLMASQAAISLENARLYTDLRDAEAYLAEAQRLSKTGSFGWRVSSGAITWSEETYQIFGLDRAMTPTLEKVFARIHPEDRQRVEEFVARRAEDGADFELDYRLQMADGAVKDLHVLARAVDDEPGETKFVGAVMDMTETRQYQKRLRASLEEKDALLKEVHHRVKNNLQLISSLLSLQASRIRDPDGAELFADSRNRVRTMALVHENLYRAGNFARIPMATHIRRLCAQLVDAYHLPGRPVQLVTAIDDVDLDMDRAVAIGLIVNELVSNALKHGFPDGRRGTVRVELRRLEERECVLSVDDDGVGMPKGFDAAQSDSLGLELVNDLAHQLHGTIAVAHERGTAFAVRFPID
jgi:PAS domain S-box-containing protein